MWQRTGKPLHGNWTQVAGLSRQCSNHWARPPTATSPLHIPYWYCSTAVPHPTAISVCRQNTFRCRPETILPPEKSHTDGFSTFPFQACVCSINVLRIIHQQSVQHFLNEEINLYLWSVADPGVVRLVHSNPPDPKPTLSNNTFQWKELSVPVICIICVICVITRGQGGSNSYLWLFKDW